MSLAEVFKFNEGTVVCTVKVDLHTVAEEDWTVIVMEKHFLCRAYFETYDYKILEFSSGIHLKGKNGKAHSHIHYVLEYKGKGDALYSNESLRRSRFVAAALRDPEHPARVAGLKPGHLSFTNVSMKWNMLDLLGIHYDTLAYPLKEGIRCGKLYSMSEELIVALQEYAQGIYNGQVAMHERRERSEEKMQCRKEEMLRVAREHRTEFDNWREMALVIEKYYLKPLPFREKPRPQDVKINCQIIAVELGIADYVDFF